MTLKYDHLIGRPFTGIGKDDCLKMVIDFYKDNFGIEIPNYARPSDWSSDQLDLMRLLPERCGFEMITEWRIKDLRPADLMCIAIREQNPNHFIIVLDDGKILHHLFGQTSGVGELRGFWRNQCSFILRHKDVPDLRPVYPDVDIRTILSARNAPPTG